MSDFYGPPGFIVAGNFDGNWRQQLLEILLFKSSFMICLRLAWVVGNAPFTVIECTFVNGLGFLSSFRMRAVVKICRICNLYLLYDNTECL